MAAVSRLFRWSMLTTRPDWGNFKLYSGNTHWKEPAVQMLSKTFTSSRFQTAVEVWQRQAEWTIPAYMWQSA
jgi:hypothetical protein